MEEYPAALGASRQSARFLCGLTSPALTANKLTRHPLFGTLQSYNFAQVFAWCEELLEDAA
jgi:ATP-dependent DNA helicase RecQ